MRDVPSAHVLLLVALVTGCGGETGGTADRSSEAVVRDSAGVRIVESTAPAWGPGEAWTIDPVPALQIGVVEGEEAYQFTSIWTAVRHPDGRVAVVDAGTSEIRIFGADGGHVSTMGGRGEGPGEFRRIPFIRWALPDTMVAWDPSGRRLSWFDARGQLIRDQSLIALLTEKPVQTLGRSPMAWQLAPDAKLLAVGSGIEMDGDWRRGFFRPTIVDPTTEAVIPLIQYAIEDDIASSVGSVANPFAHYSTPAVRVEPFTVFVAAGPRWELIGYGLDGSITEIVRAAVPRVPITSQIIETERGLLRDRAAGRESSPAPYLDAFRMFLIPDSLPAISGVMADAVGNLWASRRMPRQSPPAAWVLDVVDQDGRWLGAVSRPEDIVSIFEIGDDYLLAHWRDDLSVSYVRVYRIRKPGQL